MINWKRYSIDQIKKKWADFHFARDYPNKCVKKAQLTCHITCLEREALIDHLLEKVK